MKMVSFFVFLTFALVLSHQDVDKKMLPAKQHVTIDSTYKALQLLMQEETPYSQDNSQLTHKGKMPKIQIPKIINNMDW